MPPVLPLSHSSDIRVACIRSNFSSPHQTWRSILSPSPSPCSSRASRSPWSSSSSPSSPSPSSSSSSQPLSVQSVGFNAGSSTPEIRFLKNTKIVRNRESTKWEDNVKKDIMGGQHEERTYCEDIQYNLISYQLWQVSTQSTATSPILSSCHQLQPPTPSFSPLLDQSQSPSNTNQQNINQQLKPNQQPTIDRSTFLSPLNLDFTHNNHQQRINHQTNVKHQSNVNQHQSRTNPISPLLLSTVGSPTSRHSSSRRSTLIKKSLCLNISCYISQVYFLGILLYIS